MAKIRGGFVSNSSSSSFIITLPSDKEISFDTVAQELIPGQDPSEVCFIAYDDPIDASSAISSVVHEIRAGMKDKTQVEYEKLWAKIISIDPVKNVISAGIIMSNFGLHGKLNLHQRSLRTTKNLGEMFMWLSTVTMTVRSIPQWNMAMCSTN